MDRIETSPKRQRWALHRPLADFLAIELDAELFEIVVRQASLEFMLMHKPKFADPIMLAASANHGLLPPNDTITKVKTGRVCDHKTELPVEIGAEIDFITHEQILLMLYYETLCDHGVVNYSFEQCWDDDRLGMFETLWREVELFWAPLVARSNLYRASGCLWPTHLCGGGGLEIA